MSEKKKNKVTIGQAFKAFVWPRRKMILIGLLLIIISRLSGLVLPGASKYLVDDVIANADMEMLKVLVVVVVIVAVVLVDGKNFGQRWKYFVAIVARINRVH